MMSEQDMENPNEKEKFDDDLISTETLHDIRDGNQTHPNIDKREARLKICDHIKQKKSQWKVALIATHKMGKGLHKVFSTIVNLFPSSEKLLTLLSIVISFASCDHIF